MKLAENQSVFLIVLLVIAVAAVTIGLASMPFDPSLGQDDSITAEPDDDTVPGPDLTPSSGLYSGLYCTDSDMTAEFPRGADLKVKGTTRGVRPSSIPPTPDDIKTEEDYCTSATGGQGALTESLTGKSDYLVEFYCVSYYCGFDNAGYFCISSPRVHAEVVECECVDGVCLDDYAERTCENLHEGGQSQDHFKLGELYYFDGIHEWKFRDNCKGDFVTLGEYYCTDDAYPVAHDEIDCTDYGMICENGACVSSGEPTVDKPEGSEYFAFLYDDGKYSKIFCDYIEGRMENRDQCHDKLNEEGLTDDILETILGHPVAFYSFAVLKPDFAMGFMANPAYLLWSVPEDVNPPFYGWAVDIDTADNIYGYCKDSSSDYCLDIIRQVITVPRWLWNQDEILTDSVRFGAMAAGIVDGQTYLDNPDADPGTEDNFLTKWSDEMTVNRDVIPDNLLWSQKYHRLTWDAVIGADTYGIEIYDEDANYEHEGNLNPVGDVNGPLLKLRFDPDLYPYGMGFDDEDNPYIDIDYIMIDNGFKEKSLWEWIVGLWGDEPFEVEVSVKSCAIVGDNIKTQPGGKDYPYLAGENLEKCWWNLAGISEISADIWGAWNDGKETGYQSLLSGEIKTVDVPG